MGTNQEYIEKADMAVANLTSGGLLQPDQAKEFIEIMVEESTLLTKARTFTMKAPSMELSQLGFTGRLLHAAVEGRALPLADRSTPELAKTTLTTKEVVGEVDIPYSVVEDNVINGSFVPYVMDAMGKAAARDVEDLAINGDTTSTDPYLAQFNGFLALATSRVINAGGVRLTKTPLKQAVQTMPSRFLRRGGAMSFFTSKNAVIDYGDSIINRQTPLGDDKLENGDATGALRYLKYPVEQVPIFPETQGVGTNMTSVLFGDPKNMAIGIQRDIRIETDRDISARVFKIVITMRFGVALVYEPAMVKITNVLASAGA